jgi:hypothetical protein
VSVQGFDPPESCDCPAFTPDLTFHLVTDHADDCGYAWDDEGACVTCWGCHASRATGTLA